MNLLWHLVRHDLRRLRWQSVLLVGSIAGLVAMGLVARDSEGFDSVRLLSLSVFPMAAAAVWMSLLVSLVQVDAPAGGPAFWMTRPIAPLRLLAAKLLAAVLLGLGLPAFLQFVGMLALGSPFGVALDAAAGLAAMLGLFVPPVLLLAALTRKFFRFWAAVAVGMILFSLAVSGMRNDWPETTAAVAEARTAVGFTLLALGSLGLLAWIYRSRAVVPATACAVAMAAAIAALPWWCTWPAFWHRPDPGYVTAPATVKISVERAALSVVQPSNLRDAIECTLRWDAAGDDGALRLRRVSGTVKRSDGTVVAAASNGTGWRNRLGGAAPLAAELGGGVRLLNPEAFAAAAMLARLNPRKSDDARPTGFSGQAKVERVGYVRLGEMPLRIGERVALDGGTELRFAQKSFERRLTEPTLRERAVRDPVLALVNARRGEAFVVFGRDHAVERSIAFPGVRWSQLVVRLPQAAAAGVDAAWLEGARVVVLAEDVREWFEVPLQFELAVRR